MASKKFDIFILLWRALSSFLQKISQFKIRRLYSYLSKIARVAYSLGQEKTPRAEERRVHRNYLVSRSLLPIYYSLRSTVHGPLSMVHGPRSTVHGPRATVYSLQSTIYSLQRTIYNIANSLIVIHIRRILITYPLSRFSRLFALGRRDR